MKNIILIICIILLGINLFRPTSFHGNIPVPVGRTTVLSTSSPDGEWRSDNDTIATINPQTGELLGLSAGTTYVSYIFGEYNESLLTGIITVNPSPVADE
jgi:hypothetical protein